MLTTRTQPIPKPVRVYSPLERVRGHKARLRDGANMISGTYNPFPSYPVKPGEFIRVDERSMQVVTHEEKTRPWWRQFLPW